MSVPGPPSMPFIYNIKVSSLNVGWDPPEDNGGATILGYQLGYGQNPASPTTIISASSGVSVTNLPMGTMNYFWVKAQNYQGWGPWSPETSAKTFLGAYVRDGGIWKIAIPYVNVGGFWHEAEPTVFKSS